jgi:phospholipase C
VQLPSTIADRPPDDERHPSYIPVPPTVQALPQQESGIRPARAVPYVCSVAGAVLAGQDAFQIQFANHGTYTAVYQVYTGAGEFAPRTYTVSPNAEVSDTWNYGTVNQYNLLVFGPNGFYRVFKGSFGAGAADLQTQITYDITRKGINLEVANAGSALTQVRMFDYYTQQTTQRSVEPNQSFTEFWSLERFYGWYDITIAVETDSTFQKRLAGHLETGEDSMTDPALDGSLTQPAVQ